MTVLARPPAAAADRRAPARRAVIRWATRLFRREWRQQVLVLLLIGVAVASTILGAAVATNSAPPGHAGFGTANRLITVPGDDPALARDVAVISRRIGPVDVIENRALATGLVQGAQLRAQAPHGRFGSPMLALRSGRYPRGAGEVAMTSALAKTYGVHVGSSWADGAQRSRVVGLVENPQNLLDEFALVAPGQLQAPTRVTVLFDAPPRLPSIHFPRGLRPVTPTHSNGIDPALIVLAVAIVGLIFIGLVATAGFTVLAQRRLRSLGVLSALGATDRDVRLVIVANGAVVGVVGAVLGGIAGLVGWIAYAPHLSVSAHHRIPWTSLPWWLVGAAVLLAIATAVLASRRPARLISQVPVVSALTGRPAPAKPLHRSAVPGAVLLALGGLLLATSGGWGSGGGSDTGRQLGGLLACALGLLLLAPLALSLTGLVAPRLPVAARIALRDLGRYRARSGAALAATSFAVLIAMLISLIATGRYADPVDYFGPNLPANEVVVDAPPTGVSAGTAASTVSSIAVSVGSRRTLVLDSTDVMLARASGAGFAGGPGTVYVATPAVLAHYGVPARDVRPDTMLITSRAGLIGTSGLALIYGDFRDPQGPKTLRQPAIQRFAQLPGDTADPNLLVTPAAVARLRLHVWRSAAWLLHAPRALTASQINAARQQAAGAGLTIQVKNDAPSLSQVRDYATFAGMLLALGVLAMTVGLIRSETTAEVRTLTATGAGPRARRTITASTAGTLALLGAVLGTAVAYLATVAFFHNQLSQRMADPPTLDLLLALVALPVVATAGGWVFAGRDPGAVAKRQLD